MNQRQDQNIEEMLNSFIDGELTERQKIEVQRLIAHDAKIAQRLRQLQKCKMLVASLPRAEAPVEMTDQIKVSLERRALLTQPTYDRQRFYERTGARDLLFRKVLATAAMLGLIAILGAVIYSIVAPEAVPDKPSAEVRVIAAGPNRRLELRTNTLATVNAFIDNAIEDKLLNCSSSTRQTDKSEYALTCSREDLNLLLTGLANRWEQTKLVIETGQVGDKKVFDEVNAEQFAKIVGDLITPPKPDLTGERPIEKPIQADDMEKVRLTIVVVSSK